MAEPRRRDSAQTRGIILRTARTHFAARGFDQVTVRAIAADAAVSPNLITRYFGGKAGLFTAATEAELHLADALPGPRAALGRRIAAHVVGRWEGRPGDDPLLMMMRAAMSDPAAAARMAEFYRCQATVPLVEHLRTADARERAAAVSALIMGTVVQRYVLAAGPAATADPDAVQGWLAHALQQLLTGRSFPTLAP